MALTWEQVVNSKTYQNADDEGKESLRQQFEAQNDSDTSNQTEQPTTQQPKAKAKTNLTWEQVEKSKTYQNADDEGKQDLIRQFREAGGEYDPGVLSTLGTNLETGAYSALAGTEQAIAGNVESVADKLGLSSVSQTARDIDEYTQNAYKRNVVDVVKDTGVGESGMKYGEAAFDTAVQVGLDLVTKSTAAGAGYQGLKEHGKTYAQTGSEDEALKSGGIALAMNSVMPALIGKGVNKIASKTGLDVATQKAAQLVGLGEKSASTVNKVVSSTTNAATQGAVLTGTQAGLEEYRQTGDVTKAVKKGFEEAPTGALIGAGFGVAAHGVGAVAERRAAIKEKATETGRAKVDQQENDIAQAQTESAHAKAEAYENSPEYNTVNAAHFLNEHGAPTTHAAFNDSPESQSLFGINRNYKANTNKKLQDQIIKGGAEAFDNINSGLSKIKENIDSFITKSRISGKPKNDFDASLIEFNKTVKNMKSAAKKGDWETYNNLAPEADHIFANRLSPEAKESILHQFDGIKGISDDLDFVKIGHTAKAADDMLSKQSPKWGKVKEISQQTDALKAGKDMAMRFAAHHASGGLSTALEIGKDVTKFYTNKIRAKKQTAANQKTLERMQTSDKPATEAQRIALRRNAHPEADNPELTQAQAMSALGKGKIEPEIDISEAPEDLSPQEKFAYRRSKRIETENLKSVKERFSNPEIADRVTPENMNDKDFIDTLVKEDKATDVEKVKADIERRAKAKATKEDTAHELNTSELARFGTEEGSHLITKDKDYIAEAVRKHTVRTPRGERIANADRIKTTAQKLFEKDNPVPNTENHFNSLLNTITNATDRAELKARIVDPLFANNAKPSPEAVKSALKDIHSFKAEGWKSAGKKTLADKENAEYENSVKIIDQSTRAKQISKLRSALNKSFKDSGITPEQQKEFVDSHISKVFRSGKPLSNTEIQTHVSNAEQTAKAHVEELAKKPVTDEGDHIPKAPKTKREQKAVDTHLATEIVKALSHRHSESELAKVQEIADRLYGESNKEAHRAMKGIINRAKRMEELKKAGVNPHDLITTSDFNKLNIGDSNQANGFKTQIAKSYIGVESTDQAHLRIPGDINIQIKRIAKYKTKEEMKKLFTADELKTAQSKGKFEYFQKTRKGGLGE